MSSRNKKLDREWFDRAENDLKYARAGERETGEHHVTCFLCHQAVEKLLNLDEYLNPSVVSVR